MNNLLMRRPDLLSLPPLPALPDDYTLRQMRPEDMPTVAAVLDRAFADEAWDAPRVADTLNEQQGVKQTLVVDFRGQSIATASAPTASPAPATCTGSPLTPTTRAGGSASSSPWPSCMSLSR